MASFRRAIELGATFIETDLQISRDGRLVAIHDDTLERTTNGTGLVSSCTLEELRRLDAGSWYGPEFAGERIPTLQEILDLAREADVVFYLELKPDTAWGAEHVLVATMRAGREAARTLVLSFSTAVLATVRRLDPILMCGFLFDDLAAAQPDPVTCALRAGARQLAPRGNLVTPALIEHAHREGLQMVAWTVNETEQMRALIASGVDGIMTDYPDRLRGVLADSASPIP